MSAALPIMKMVTLVVKQVAKPVAKAFSEGAKRNAHFKRFCVNVADLHHRAEVTVQRLMMNKNINNQIYTLNPDVAVRLGGDMLAEGFVMTVGLSFLLYPALAAACWRPPGGGGRRRKAGVMARRPKGGDEAKR